jgi:hypothetical protein
LYGCGASNIGAVCKELDETKYMCKCPGTQGFETVTAGEPFAGCSTTGPPPTPEEVVANVNANGLVSHITKDVMQVLGVIVVEVEGATFTLNVTATVPIDTLTEHLKEAIADYLMGDYTAADITIEYMKKRAHSGEVRVTVGEVTVGPGSRLGYSVAVVAGLLLALLF